MLTSLPYRVFLGLFVLFGVISVLALRANNQEMIRLRDAVYAADQQAGDVSTALNNLRTYVYGHMNTNLNSGGNTIKPPIHLKYSYERLVAAEKQRIDSINERLYPEAQAYCERQNPDPSAGRARLKCTENYVLNNGAKPNPIPPGLYQYDFVSPAWSPDLAGWSLIGCIIFLVAAVVRFVAEKLYPKN